MRSKCGWVEGWQEKWDQSHPACTDREQDKQIQDTKGRETLTGNEPQVCCPGNIVSCFCVDYIINSWKDSCPAKPIIVMDGERNLNGSIRPEASQSLKNMFSSLLLKKQHLWEHLVLYPLIKTHTQHTEMSTLESWRSLSVWWWGTQSSRPR